MTTTISVPIEILAHVHEIQGGGYWAEVPCFPGCVAQADTLQDLERNLALSIRDWLSDERCMTAEEARGLREIQGSRHPSGSVLDPSDTEAQDRPKSLRGEEGNGQHDLPNPFLPPPGWDDEDE